MRFQTFDVEYELKTQAANWTAQGSFGWTYTPGGRELTQSDPLTGTTVATTYQNPAGGTDPPPPVIDGSVKYAPKQYQYDNDGRVEERILPEGYQVDTMGYDVDDELMSYKNSHETPTGGATPDASGAALVLDARGELLFGPTGQVTSEQQSANGTIVGNIGVEEGDVRSGMALQSSYTGGGPSGTNAFTYDGSGRQMIDALTVQVSPSQGTPGPFTYTRTYDAGNHLVSAPTGPQCNINQTASACYANGVFAWRPDGRLGTIALSGPTWPGMQASYTDDAHWDGDTLLFVHSDQGGRVLYVGKLGTLNGSGGWMIADRNESGTLEAWHASASFSPWNIFPIMHFTGKYTSGVIASNWGSYCTQINCPWPAGNVLPTAQDGLDLDFVRSDGYSFGSYTIQGARIYDDNSQQWLTPDAYAGDVNDPISQKPFIWNNNNPIEWSDPSGYDPYPEIVEDFFEPGPPGKPPDADSVSSPAGASLAQQATPGPVPAPAPDFRCGPCAPVNNDPYHLGDALIAVGLGALTDGAGDALLGTAEGSGEFSLYDTSITDAGSELLNVQTNVGASEFQQNLMSNGYNVLKTLGDRTVLTNGTDIYTLYPRTSGGPGVQYFGGNGSIIKFSLGGP